jgi:hypothetical protein
VCQKRLVFSGADEGKRQPSDKEVASEHEEIDMTKPIVVEDTNHGVPLKPPMHIDKANIQRCEVDGEKSLNNLSYGRG